jgi:hypothetical protein
VALVPDDLVSRFHGAAPQAVRGGARAKREVEPERCGRRVGVQLDRLKRLDDLDGHRPDHGGVRIAVVRAEVTGEDPLATDATELQGVHLLTPREVRHRQDDHVAGTAAGMEDEEVTLAPVVVVGHDVGQRFGDLVNEQLVGGSQTRHGRAPLRLERFSTTYGRPPCRRRDVKPCSKEASRACGTGFRGRAYPTAAWCRAEGRTRDESQLPD